MSVNLDGYSLTFSDEFAGSYLDTSIWGTQYWWGGRTIASNGEMQYFADRSTPVIRQNPALDPFSIVADPIEAGDGILTITARPSPDPGLTDGLPYVSGLINTHGTFSQTYGYFEISAQVPSGQGLWPAFWLLPQSGNWPPEIDVLELLGHDPATYYVGSHWTDSRGGHFYDTQGISAGVDPSQDFHAYGTMWTADAITFYLDGTAVYSMQTPAGMSEPMYLLAGLAVGGNWPGAPDETTRFPAEFKIDYIRAWSLDTPSSIPTTTPSLKGTSGADLLVGDANANALNDIVFAYSGNDTLEGLRGNDTLAGGHGADTFLYRTGPSGNDVIVDFDPMSGDAVRVTKAILGQKNFSGLYRMIKDNPAGDAVLKLADGGSITFEGVSKAQLGYDDFFIV
ncbi:family 16 glycosylhydrolase [Microvirga sp. HBU67558]|uniref:family 16 glycosylhydrolase n=1 Tax=Microvirga TaxID=186650 RepID=UPI001B359F43|nr:MULTISPECIES: family 16 glycosylhydrolase [unclassified Microvirga]MBQ0823488.1 family 16 glycosylhydrolase [Microvirga sp. HBU67558]